MLEAPLNTSFNQPSLRCLYLLNTSVIEGGPCTWHTDACFQYSYIGCSTTGCHSPDIRTWTCSTGGDQEQPQRNARRIRCLPTWEVRKWEV